MNWGGGDPPEGYDRANNNTLLQQEPKVAQSYR